MRILLLCMYMEGRHGSVLHIFEYAKFFKSIGAEVCIGAVFIDRETREEASAAGLNVMRINNVPLDPEWDIVYALHLFLFPYLLFKGLKYKRSILALLSVRGPIEQLPPSCMWPYFDLITSLSPEIIGRYNQEFGVPIENFTLIPNPVPLDFLGSSKDKLNESIQKVAVVSNNYVPELPEMAKLAPWQTDFYGTVYDNSVQITPELLLKYDVVITIGKTVQYAMGLGIPVFEYDHFGGCGYILPDNIKAEALTNFSGRTTRYKMSPEQLVAAIKSGYGAATGNAIALQKIARDKFSIVRLVTQQMKLLSALPPRKNEKLTPDAWFFSNTCYLAVNHMLGLMQIREESMPKQTG